MPFWQKRTGTKCFGGKMSLRIIYGRAGAGKSEYCYNEIAQKIKTENKILIITPEQFSYTAEKS